MRLHSLRLIALAVPTFARGFRRQNGPIEPDTDPDCTYYDTAYSEGDDCAAFETWWDLSHADFVAWVSAGQTEHDIRQPG